MIKNKSLNPVELVDRIPDTSVDLQKLAMFCKEQLVSIKEDRSLWETRRSEYYQDIDRFFEMSDFNKRFDGSMDVHVPVTMEKLRATHARFFAAIFGVNPPFFTEPQEPMDEARLKSINQLMKWILSRGCNYYKGAQGSIDDWLWNICADGWGILRLKWDCKLRKALRVEEKFVKNKKVAPKENADGSVEFNPPIRLEEKFDWVKVFEGGIVENIQPEDVFMPGCGDIGDAPFVAIRSKLSGHELNLGKARKFFIKESVDSILPHPDYSGTYDDDIKNVKAVNQGVDDKRGTPHSNSYDVYECYVTFDVDDDGFDEELIAVYHESSNTILRWTYLDRVTKTGRRPLYKADYIRRPGRNYSLGLGELLHTLSMEVNTIHNQRVDFGTFSNMPFFFYRSGSTLPNEPIKIAPGKGIPIDEPTQSVYFPQLGNRTAWGFQEEQLLFSLISRVSSVSDLSLGQPVSPAEITRTQGGVAALISEGNSQLDVTLRRVRTAFSELLFDLHQIYVEKLPRDFQHVIIGDDGQPDIDLMGNTQFNTIQDPRRDISGRVHFNITATSATGNKQYLRQQAIVLAQQYLNPMNLQLGIVGPEQVYEINKYLGELSDVPGVGRFLKKPQAVKQPMELIDELNMIKQGLVPEVVMNDNHSQKIEMINRYRTSPQVMKGMELGTISPNVQVAAEVTIGKHQMYLDLVNAQNSAFQNVTGSNINLALGANPGGVGQLGGTLAPPQGALPSNPQQGPGPLPLQ